MFKILEKRLTEIGQLKSLTLVVRSNTTKDGFVVAIQASTDGETYGPINAKGTAQEFEDNMEHIFNELFNKLTAAGTFELDTSALDAQLSEDEDEKRAKHKAKSTAATAKNSSAPAKKETPVKEDPDEAVIKEIKFKNAVDLTQDYDKVQDQYQKLIWAIEAALKTHKKNAKLKTYYTEMQNTFAKWRMENEPPELNKIQPNTKAAETANVVAPEPIVPDHEEEELPVINPLEKVVNVQVEPEEIEEEREPDENYPAELDEPQIEEDVLQPMEEEDEVPFGGEQAPESTTDPRLNIFGI